MPGEPQETRPSNGQPEIPQDLEDQILKILDTTESGFDRNAAIAALHLTDELREAVRLWLEPDANEDVDFLPSPTTGTEVSTDPDALPRRFGEYILESILGRGGMGIVYRARDLRLRRVVALKVLPERFADNMKRLDRFRREIHAVAGLTHPSIVPVFDAGQVGATPYFTMEFVAGRSLDKAIVRLAKLDRPVNVLSLRDWHEAIGEEREASSGDRTERTYLEAVCNLIINIAEALQHAHDGGVIHRDVKPSNIIAPSAGRAKLFDFGLARSEDDLEMTRSSELIGSPHYMSPEQVDGSATIDHRTDIYSLGVTLYELLTLKMPFRFDSPQQIYNSIAHREPRRPGLINPQLPKDVETICLTAMDKNADRRFQSAADLADDLRRFLRFEPITARPIGAVTRSVRWLRRNRTPVSIIALLLIAVVALWSTRTSGKKLKNAEVRVSDLEKSLSDRERSLKASIKNHEFEVGRLASRILETKRASASASRELEESKHEVRTQRAEIDARETEIGKLNEIKRNVKEEYDRQTESLASAEAKEKTLSLTNKRLERENAGQRRMQGQMKRDLAVARARFGTLEQNYAVTTINKLLMEARTLRTSNAGLGLMLGYEAATLLGNPRTPKDADLSMRVDDTLLELLRSTQEQLTYTGHSHPVTAIDFSPSGTSVVSTSSAGAAHIWNRETGRPRSLLRTTSSLVHVEYFAEDWLLLAREDGRILTWDGRSDSTPRILAGAFHQSSTRMHVAPDGRFIVSHVSRLPGLLRVHLRGNGEPQRTLGTDANPIIDFEFSPVRTIDFAVGRAQNRIVATTISGDVEIWNVEDGSLQASIPGSASLLSATFDAQGRRIASLDARGVVRVISVTDESIQLTERIENGSPLGSGRIAFCAGDRRLLVSATGSDDHLILDPRDGKIIARIPARGAPRGFDLDRKRLVACLADPAGGFDLRNTLNGRPVARLSEQSQPRRSGHRPVVAFSPDRGSLATVHGEANARIWRTRPGGALQSVGPDTADELVDRTTEKLQLARFEGNNGRLVTLSNLGLSSWHLASGRRFFLAQDRRRPLTPQALARHGDGIVFFNGRVKKFVSGARPSSRTLRAIDAEHVDQVTSWPGGGVGVVLAGEDPDNRRHLLLLDARGKERRNIELPPGKTGGGTPLPSPDGARFVIGYDVLTVIETDRPELRVRLPFSRGPVAFSPDGLRVAASTGFSIKVWNVRGGAGWCELSDLPTDYSELTCLAFSPDGKRLGSAWSDGMIRVYDVSRRGSRRPRLAFSAHRQRIHSLRFSADGSLLLSSSADGRARLWHSDSGRPRLTFAPGTPCVDAEFSDDGRRVLVVCPRRVHVFPLDPRPLAAQARPRELTSQERDRFGIAQRH